MKLSRSAIIVAALATATTASLVLTQNQAQASTIATITTKGPAALYDINGNKITNRALSPNSKWAVGTIFVSGDKGIYQVSTNEYLRSTDATLTGDYAYIQPSKAANTKLTGKIINGTAQLYRDDTNSMSNRLLANGSNWAVGKHYMNKNGDNFFQVSTHEYVNGKHISLNHIPQDTTYSANFGIAGATVDTSTDTTTSNNDNNNDWSNVGTDNNSTSVNTNTNNNSNNNVDTNTNTSTNTNTNTASYKPNLANINKYFVEYLNALHKANGTDPVNLSNDLMTYAQQRAGQQDGGNLDHSTATRNLSENLSSAGFNYMSYIGVKSDKDAAYFLLKDWYDEDNNYYPMGQAGHFGHRAALIYSGPNVGLGITDGDAAFNADWNDLDQLNALYDYTGSNPNTKFISKDSI